MHNGSVEDDVDYKLPPNVAVYWPLQMLEYYKSASSCCHVLLEVFVNTKSRQIILRYQLIVSLVSCSLLWFVENFFMCLFICLSS